MCILMILLTRIHDQILPNILQRFQTEILNTVNGPFRRKTLRGRIAYPCSINVFGIVYPAHGDKKGFLSQSSDQRKEIYFNPKLWIRVFLFGSGSLFFFSYKGSRPDPVSKKGRNKNRFPWSVGSRSGSGLKIQIVVSLKFETI